MSRIPFDNFDQFNLAVAMGAVQGFSNRNVFGYNPDVPTIAHGDVTPFTNTYVFPSNTGQAMEIVSSNAADVGISITVVGLDENWLDKTQIVVLNGMTPVALSGLWSRINYVFHSSLTDVEFQGNVDVRGAGGGTIFSRALSGAQESSQTVFSVPDKKYWIVNSLIGTITKSIGSAGSNVEILFTIRFRGGVWRHPFSFGLQRDGQSSISFENFYPERLNGPADIICQAQASDAGIKTAVRYGVLMWNTGVPS